MVIVAVARLPLTTTLVLSGADARVADAGDAPAHQVRRVALPVLIVLGAKPGAGVIAPFLGEAGGVKTPSRIAQAVIERLRLLVLQE